MGYWGLVAMLSESLNRGHVVESEPFLRFWSEFLQSVSESGIALETVSLGGIKFWLTLSYQSGFSSVRRGQKVLSFIHPDRGFSGEIPYAVMLKFEEYLTRKYCTKLVSDLYSNFVRLSEMRVQNCLGWDYVALLEDMGALRFVPSS